MSDTPAATATPAAAATPAAVPTPATEAKATEVKSDEVVKKKKKNWLPLESDVNLMNNYIHALGVSRDVGFHEVFGFDEELLAFLPSPAYALLMCFPVSEASEKHRSEEAEAITKAGQTVDASIWHTTQKVGNACGTVGLLHAVLNNAPFMGLAPGKFFAKFLAETKDMTPEQRGAALEANTDIEVEHQAVASQGTSRVDSAVNKLLHFNCFIVVNGNLYEMDGRKKFPINHGPSSPMTLARDAIKIVKQFMARDPKDIRFNCVLMAPQ